MFLRTKNIELLNKIAILQKKNIHKIILTKLKIILTSESTK